MINKLKSDFKRIFEIESEEVFFRYIMEAQKTISG